MLTAEEAVAYMKSNAFVEGEELHVTGVATDVYHDTEHNSYTVTFENGFKIYSGVLKAGVKTPEVGDTVTASGKSKIYVKGDSITYEIAWDKSHNQNPSIYEVTTGGNTTPPSGGDNDNPPSGGDNDNPPSGETKATFSLGSNGSATHTDGTAKSSYSETNNNKSLSISSGVQFYIGATDAKGNSCLKIGSGNSKGSFTITVDGSVNKVIIYVAGYKKNSAKITVNGKSYDITTLSNNGEYTAIEIDTSSNKTISFSTETDGTRCMINTIEFK